MNTLDLFTPRVKPSQLHPYFQRLIEEKSYKDVLSTIENWSKCMDGRREELDKFIKEFQISFNSSFWELYLNKAFQDLGFEIDYSKESPDFHLIHSSGRIVNVEAVTSKNKDVSNKNYYTQEAYKETIENKSKDEAILKLLGKIKDKRDLFLGNNGKKYPYSKLDHVKGKPFVLAIAPFDTHLSYMQNNTFINQVLYGVLPPEVEDINSTSSKKIDYVINKNSQKINLGIFTNDSYKEISAIIFSTTATFGKAISQSKMSNTTIRSTRFRIFGLNNFIAQYGVKSFGVNEKKLSETHTVRTTRMPIDDIVFRNELINKGLEQSKKFSWDKCFDETYSFYQAVHNRKYGG